MYGWIWSNCQTTFTWENEFGECIIVNGVSESKKHPYNFPDVKCVGKVTKFISNNSSFKTIDSLYEHISIKKIDSNVN